MKSNLKILIATAVALVTVLSIVVTAVNNKTSKNDANDVVYETQASMVNSSMSSESETETEEKQTTEVVTEGQTTAETTTAEVEAPIPTYTEEDLYLLAAAICNEAGAASEEIQLLVANVIVNRIESDVFPDTMYDVLTQYRQYGMMWKYGVHFPAWADEEIIEQCYNVARRILEGERFCPEDVLFQAEFAQGSAIYKQYPGYFFCYY